MRLLCWLDNAPLLFRLWCISCSRFHWCGFRGLKWSYCWSYSSRQDWCDWWGLSSDCSRLSRTEGTISAGVIKGDQLRIMWFLIEWRLKANLTLADQRPELPRDLWRSICGQSELIEIELHVSNDFSKHCSHLHMVLFASCAYFCIQKPRKSIHLIQNPELKW